MEFIVGLMLGMLAATLLIRWMAQRAIAKILVQIEQEKEPEPDNQLRVDVEFEQNIYFLYNSDDGSFVAQGTDLLNLRDNLRQRFPNRTITIVNGNATAMETLKSQLENFEKTKTA